ncbi:recombinase family protein [Desulforudis sp. 1088]|uniref:recombinase family protein n=1 Tax=unclassified Candidatus Desulforudis TaxID=2635950 RepID=UPI0034995905
MISVIYVRSPAGGSVHEIEAQIEQCRDYARRLGSKSIEVYSDIGATGWTLDRPGLQAALNRIEDGDVDYFIFSHLSCLSHRVRDQLLLIKTLEDMGVAVVSVKTPIPHPLSLICLQEKYLCDRPN